MHRDVKPANVLVDMAAGADGADHCYLTDFGLTKDTSQSKRFTATDQFVGTLNYVAPEQIDGVQQGPATDEYALACVLYECLTGRPVFDRPTELDVMWAHLSDAPPRLSALRPDLALGLDDVLARALAKAPEDRYPSCAAMVAAARAATSAPPTAAAPTVISPVPAASARTRLSPRPAAGDAPPTATPTDARPPGTSTDTPPPGTPADASPPATPAPTPAPGAPADGPPPATPAEPPLPAAAARTSATPRRAGSRIAFAGAAIAAVVVAAVIGTLAGGGGDAPSDGAPKVAAVDGISLRYPADWEGLPLAPTIPGLALARRMGLSPRDSGGRDWLVAGVLRASAAPMLPATLATGPGDGHPARVAVRLGTADAFRYTGLYPTGFTGPLTLYVVLTDRGRAMVACYAATPSASFQARCADVAGSFKLTDAKALALAPSPRYAAAVTAALHGLAARRTAGRRRLRAASTSTVQARAATALAASYASAARRVKALPAPPAARPVNSSIAAALRALGATYRHAASAARRHDRGRWLAARRAARRGDVALQTAVGALGELGYATT